MKKARIVIVTTFHFYMHMCEKDQIICEALSYMHSTMETTFVGMATITTNIN